MILVDTSVWVDHLRDGNARLASLLNEGKVICHPFVLGELACGNLRNREEILNHLRALPSAIQAEDAEAMQFIEDRSDMDSGLGYIDVHLLVSTILTGVRFWTLDVRLDRFASRMGVSASA